MQQGGYRGGFPQQQPPQRSPAHAAVARRGIGPMIAGQNPQTSMTPNQMATHQAALDRASDLAKRRSRKPTDKNVPEGIENTIIGDGVKTYKDLRDFERRLDAVMTRKRLDILDAKNRGYKHYKTLRVWINNTVEDQPWQVDSADMGNMLDFSSATESFYQVVIQGKLLNEPDSDNDNSEDEDDPDVMDEDGKDNEQFEELVSHPEYKLSHFLKSMTVDFDRGSEQAVEWKKPAVPANAANPPDAADFDKLAFRRRGDENMNITINLVLDEPHQTFQLSPALSDIMDTDKATKGEAIAAVWAYIQAMGLQEDDEKRTFRCDDNLKLIFGGRETGFFPFIGDALIPHMTTSAPLKLDYTIRVDQEFHKDPKPTVYDIRVPVEDPLAAKYNTYINNPKYVTTLRDIMSLDDQLAIIVQAIGNSKAKHGFFDGMAKHPVEFLNKWTSSQTRDLEVMMGEATRGGGEDASGDEFRRGGPGSIWASENVRESVNLMLSQRR